MNYGDYGDFGGFGGFGGGFDIMFTLVPIGIGIVFVIVLISALMSLLEWNKNNHSPILTVEAVVATKRTSVTRHASSGNSMHRSHTNYYVTFQMESGDRMELSVEGEEFGMLAEGDQGKLKFQGTRYLEFQRT